MTVTGVEVVFIHLSIGPVKVPMIMIETVYRSHYPGAMPAARAVHEKLAGGWIASDLQKRINLLRAWIRFINEGDINVAHSSSLNGRLLALPGIVSQIDD